MPFSFRLSFCTCAKPGPFMETSGFFFEVFETAWTGGYKQNQIPAQLWLWPQLIHPIVSAWASDHIWSKTLKRAWCSNHAWARLGFTVTCAIINPLSASKKSPQNFQSGISRNSPPNNICKCKNKHNKGT